MEILDRLEDVKDSHPFRQLRVGSASLKFLPGKLIKKFVNDFGQKPDSILGLTSESDLVPNVYEGGFKVWECTSDLIDYLNFNHLILPQHKVFEIGCGSGLVGINCLHQGANLVHFQDYNEDVLSWFTVPNVLINCNPSLKKEEKVKFMKEKCHFYSGSWDCVANRIRDDGLKYDIILSSETIYNIDQYHNLLQLIVNALSPHGKAYIAGKNYYFGVGGSMQAFLDFVLKDGRLTGEICHIVTTSVPREIIKLSWRTYIGISFYELVLEALTYCLLFTAWILAQ